MKISKKKRLIKGNRKTKKQFNKTKNKTKNKRKTRITKKKRVIMKGGGGIFFSPHQHYERLEQVVKKKEEFAKRVNDTIEYIFDKHITPVETEEEMLGHAEVLYKELLSYHYGYLESEYDESTYISKKENYVENINSRSKDIREKIRKKEDSWKQEWKQSYSNIDQNNLNTIGAYNDAENNDDDNNNVGIHSQTVEESQPVKNFATKVNETIEYIFDRHKTPVETEEEMLGHAEVLYKELLLYHYGYLESKDDDSMYISKKVDYVENINSRSPDILEKIREKEDSWKQEWKQSYSDYNIDQNHFDEIGTYTDSENNDDDNNNHNNVDTDSESKSPEESQSSGRLSIKIQEKKNDKLSVKIQEKKNDKLSEIESKLVSDIEKINSKTQEDIKKIEKKLNIDKDSNSSHVEIPVKVIKVLGINRKELRDARLVTKAEKEKKDIEHKAEKEKKDIENKAEKEKKDIKDKAETQESIVKVIVQLKRDLTVFSKMIKDINVKMIQIEKPKNSSHLKLREYRDIQKPMQQNRAEIKKIISSCEIECFNLMNNLQKSLKKI